MGLPFSSHIQRFSHYILTNLFNIGRLLTIYSTYDLYSTYDGLKILENNWKICIKNYFIELSEQSSYISASMVSLSKWVPSDMFGLRPSNSAWWQMPWPAWFSLKKGNTNRVLEEYLQIISAVVLIWL